MPEYVRLVVALRGVPQDADTVRRRVEETLIEQFELEPDHVGVVIDEAYGRQDVPDLGRAVAAWVKSIGGCLICQGRSRRCLYCNGRAWKRLHSPGFVG